MKLSQCLIVKNEENNIEKALSWAKEIAFEQIVVDTGSTDRTIEIAERMGAIVYHFEWKDDFSAAKNYLIDKASGDWIILLDADEFFPPGEADKLARHIERIESDPQLREKCIALSCSWDNVDESGKPMSTGSNVRMFRNIPSIRFSGRIHEQHYIDPERVVRMDDVRFIHTGYSITAFKGKNKLERNVRILRAEIENDPDNINAKAYLADSLKLSENDADKAEAKSIFTGILESSPNVELNYKLRIKAYVFFMNKYVNDPEKRERCEELCNRALDEFPGALDFEYFLASVLNYKGEYQTAWKLLKAGEERLASKSNTGVSFYVPADPTMLYGQLLLAAQGLGDVDNIIRYATMILVSDKTRIDILCPLIATLLRCGTTEDELLVMLAEIYDTSDPGDLLLIARAAKNCGAIELASGIMKKAKKILDIHTGSA